MKFKVFYSCYTTNDHIDSKAPIEYDKDTMIDLALHTLRGEGDFYGLIDDNDLVFQFIFNSDRSISLDIPIPEKQGSFIKKMNIDEIERILISLSNPIIIEKIKGLKLEYW